MNRLLITTACAIACALLLTLTGCGGGSSDPSKQQLTGIQQFGDSTAYLQGPDLEQRYPGLVDNQAVPGTSTAQLLAGTDGKHTEPFPFPVAADKVVIVKFGANDSLPWFNTRTDQFKANLRTIVSGIRASGSTAVLETPDPTLDVARPNEPAYTQAMRDVAKETGAALIDTDACWRAYGHWQDFIGADNEHANEKGRAYTVTNCVAPVIDTILKH